MLSINKKCMVFRRKMAAPETQRMGDMPEEIQGQDPVFRKVGVDLAGPYLMKAD